MVVRNIKWDTDGDKEVFDSLPQEVVLPDYLTPSRYSSTRNRAEKSPIKNATVFCSSCVAQLMQLKQKVISSRASLSFARMAAHRE